MAREGALKAEGTVVEVLPGFRYRVELANGHRLLAFVSGQARTRFAGLVNGDRVRLAVSPCDLSTGQIILEKQTI